MASMFDLRIYMKSGRLFETPLRICGTTSMFRTLIDWLCLPWAWDYGGAASGLCAFTLYLGVLPCQLNTGGWSYKTEKEGILLEEDPRPTTCLPQSLLTSIPREHYPLVQMLALPQRVSRLLQVDNLPSSCFHHPGHYHLRLPQMNFYIPPPPPSQLLTWVLRRKFKSPRTYIWKKPPPSLTSSWNCAYLSITKATSTPDFAIHRKRQISSHLIIVIVTTSKYSLHKLLTWNYLLDPLQAVAT